jgi:hypothetical protein
VATLVQLQGADAHALIAPAHTARPVLARPYSPKDLHVCAVCVLLFLLF